jgi:hypothetical protein
MEVRLVALKAQKRLVLLQQEVRHRTMRLVAHRTIFLYRRVLEHERPLMAGVALIAEVVGPFIRSDEPRDVSVHVVAAAAAHESFPYWMVGGILHLCGNVLMTLGAELGLGRFE